MIQALKNFPTWAYQLSLYITLFSVFAIVLMRRFKSIIKEGRKIEGESYGEKTVQDIQNFTNIVLMSSIGFIALIIVTFIIYFVVALS